MRAIAIQPPFVQLNAPYPAVFYLDAFLRARGVRSEAVDHSIAVTRRVFSRDGLALVFRDAREALKGRKHPDAETARRVGQYFEAENDYLALVEPLVAFLSGEDPAFAYRLASGAGLPAGMRAEAVLGESGALAPDEARAYATAVLSDLSDFIAYALDPGFGTVRYAERVARSAPSFGPILESAGRGWTMERFYRPLLRELFLRLGGPLADAAGPGNQATGPKDDDRVLVLLSAPFPGCMVGAAAAALEARAALGDRATIVLGGGYVSTELRFLDDAAVFDVFDYLAYDSGYGALASMLDVMDGAPADGLYRVRRREAGRVVALGFPPDEPCPAARDSDREASQAAGRYAALDAEAVRAVHPDYAGVNFGDYLRIVDSPNPMQRLWNDTPWLKYRLAYGCYWHRCEFCDTELDYIKRYAPSGLDELLAAMDRASSRSGLYGVHFVDEAMPAPMVRRFAERNAARRRPFTFWGNVRYDTAWDDDTARFAAERGLVAVSGGIEIATGAGLSIVDKGLTLPGLVRSLLAFKRSGVLTHAYLIYGFPGQSDQDIADSAEMTRVLLAEGLVDSAFWHRFVLTRHSRIYAEWERGERPELAPEAPKSAFAVNDVDFRGEERSERWTAPLDAALAAWADGGETDKPLSAFLPKGLPRPRIDAASVLREAGL